MILDFNETCIVNQTPDTNNKGEYIRSLMDSLLYTEEPELKDSLKSLINKISTLDEYEFQKLLKDKRDKKIFTYPPYML